jgi:hypothetical protein
MPRLRKNDNLRRVNTSISLDPRVLAYLRLFSEKKSMSIGEIVEKALMKCEDTPDLSFFDQYYTPPININERYG